MPPPPPTVIIKELLFNYDRAICMCVCHIIHTHTHTHTRSYQSSCSGLICDYRSGATSCRPYGRVPTTNPPTKQTIQTLYVDILYIYIYREREAMEEEEERKTTVDIYHIEHSLKNK